MPETVERVLLITHELSFRGSSILLLRLAQGLRERGIEIVVLCTRRKSIDPGLTEKVRVEVVPGFTVPFWGRVVRRTVLQNLIDQPPDVIHVLGPRMLPQSLWLARSLNCPLILGLTDQAEANRIMLPSTAHICKGIICVSDSVKAAIPSRLEQFEQRVILPGVPLNLAANERQGVSEERTPVIGMAGPLEVIKGGSFFLRACHRVVESGRSLRVVIAGSGPEEKNLRKLSTSLEMDQYVTFVDDGVAMADFLSAIDIFCLPSLQQGFGVIMLEAMALGCPSIASGVGGILSIIEDGVNGLIVPPSDSRALAERMMELLDDPGKAARIAIAGQNLVEDRFTVERMTEETLLLYNEVVATENPSVAAIPIPLKRDNG